MPENAQNAEIRLMKAVKAACGAALDAFAPSSSVPIAFWAALTANESGENIERGEAIGDIKRREPAVYSHLALVAAGFVPRYGSIAAADFDHPETPPLPRPLACHEQPLRQATQTLPRKNPLQSSVTVAELLGWSTSWGWTQMMGYHCLRWEVALEELWDPARHYHLAAGLMGGFISQYDLDPTKDFEGMARCWNTGRPDGATYDLRYLPNLMKHMQAWKEI